MSSGSGAVLQSLGGVAMVGFLSYFGEYASFIVVLAWISDKLTITYGTGVYGYGLVGVISGAYLVLSGLIAVPMGHLCDRFGRRRLAIAGCLLGALGLLLLLPVGLAASSAAFLIEISIALLALGVGHGTYTASTLAYVGDISKQENLGKSYGLIENVEFAAYAFGPGAGAVIAVFLGRELTFVFSGMVLLSAAVIALLLMRDRPRQVGPEQPDTPRGLRASLGSSWQEFISVMTRPIMAVTILTTLVISVAFTSFFIYVSIYALNASSVPYVRAVGAASGSIMAVTSIIAILPVGHLEDVTGRRMPILVAGLVTGAFGLAFAFSSPTLFALVAAALTFGVALAMARVSQYVILSENSQLGNRAAVMGTNHAMEHAGYGLGALSGGILIAAVGSVQGFRFLAAILLLSGLLFFLFALRRNVR